MDRYRIVIMPPARHDIFEIGDYISYVLLEPETSRRFLNGLRHSINQLEDFPQKFPIIDDLKLNNKDIHIMPYKNYYVFYYVYEELKVVAILRVGYNKRNWKTLL